jgi:hypothetical protein
MEDTKQFLQFVLYSVLTISSNDADSLSATKEFIDSHRGTLEEILDELTKNSNKEEYSAESFAIAAYAALCALLLYTPFEEEFLIRSIILVVSRLHYLENDLASLSKNAE